MISLPGSEVSHELELSAWELACDVSLTSTLQVNRRCP